MSFTQDQYIPVTPSKPEDYGEYIDNKEPVVTTIQFDDKESTGIKIQPSNPFPQSDYGVIITTYEMETSNWQEEDYNKVHYYRDVYSTHNFSERVREQMDYYPGMQQTTSGTSVDDPFYTNAKEMSSDRLQFWDNAMSNPDAFSAGLQSRQQDFDYGNIFGPDVSTKDRMAEIGKMLSECIPCFERFPALLPDGNLLEIHALNIKIRTDLLEKLMALLKDPGYSIDICDLLKMLSRLCPQDLLAILALLTQFLAKLNLDFRFNLNFIIQLVGPILSPFLDSLAAWLDKWVQLILAPIICVVDHINETILLAQQIQIPFSDVSANIGADIGIAAPGHHNASAAQNWGARTGLGNKTQGIAEPNTVDPHASTWGSWQWEEFNTPDKEKYNPSVPDYPTEETQLAASEYAEAWDPTLSEAERIERNARWQELRERERQKRYKVPPPERKENADGTRWSKDDIPNSEKHTTGGDFDAGYYPPEKQARPAEGTEYFVTTPIVNSIVQLRNILQGGIQYVKDWFTYITQMVYDLLGFDIGWMKKKTDNTMLKSRIIQLIWLVKAILEAISKNGLECGTHSNFNPAQMSYILQEGLGKYTSNRFRVNEDGSIVMIPPGRQAASVMGTSSSNKPTTDSLAYSNSLAYSKLKEEIPGLVPGETVQEKSKPADGQKFVESGIIIKDCFKTVSADELARTRSWIADFEKRGTA